VSEHLRILKEAGLIRDEVDGPRRSYCVNQQLLERFKALIAAL
jgi:ArsR family transcriptional regulator, arsenate/arsenite/antimonite-responsive transcriptional repressor